jgi:DNA-binding SARP family transcriptional activator
MVRLATLGGVVLLDAAGSGVSMQRRRLALLSLLSVAHERGLTRDRLLALLWPESDESRARHSLEQLFYLVRRQVGEAVFVGSDPIRLNPLAITSDVLEFEQAVAAERDEEAVALYAGPFLDGFHLGAGSEFEDWADGERSRLARTYAEALQRLATRASERGDDAAATMWWRRLVAADRLSARYMLGLLHSLADAGDRAEALRLGASHEALIREQLGIPPDPAVRALLDELRARPAVPNGVASARVRVAPTHPASDPEPVSLPPPDAWRQLGRRDAARIRLRGSVLVAGVAAFALLAGWALRASVGSNAGPDRVVLGPWRVAGDPSLAHLSETIPALLGPWFVDNPWRARGGGVVLAGDVRTGPGRLELSARLISSAADGTDGARVSVAGPSDSLTVLVDRLAARVRARLAGEGAEQVASLSTTSPEALRSYLAGRAEHRGGRATNARRAFAQALEYDSTFALPALDLALSTARVFRWTFLTADTAFVARGLGLGGEGAALSDLDLWDRAMELAWRGRDQLAPGDRALLNALRVDSTEASLARDVLAAWEGAVRAAPDRPEAHHWLGYVLLHQGLAMGLIDSRARAAASFRRALELDPVHLGALGGLIEIAAYERDSESLRSLRAKYLALSSIGAEADYVRWLVAAALPDRRELRRIRSRFSTLDLGTLARIQRTSQLAGIALEDAERADSVIIGLSPERQQRQVALYRATFLQLNRGRPEAALRLMRLKRDIDPGPELGQGYALRYALMWEGDRGAGEAGANALAVGPERVPAVTVISSPPLWRLWHGDTTGAASGIARLRTIAGPHALTLDALLANVLDRPDAPAIRSQLDSMAMRGCCDQPHFINLVAARLHERAGDVPAALAAIRRGRWFFPAEYLSTYLREEGRLADLTGDTEGAIRAYRQYLELRSDPEPTAQPAVDTVRVELARLEGVSSTDR